MQSVDMYTETKANEEKKNKNCKKYFSVQTIIRTAVVLLLVVGIGMMVLGIVYFGSRADLRLKYYEALRPFTHESNCTVSNILQDFCEFGCEISEHTEEIYCHASVDYVDYVIAVEDGGHCANQSIETDYYRLMYEYDDGGERPCKRLKVHNEWKVDMAVGETYICYVDDDCSDAIFGITPAEVDSEAAKHSTFKILCILMIVFGPFVCCCGR